MRNSFLRKAFGAVLAGLTVAVGVGGPSFAADGAIVRTANGSVRGAVAADHRSFEGIPYAAPPVGALRWRAPIPARPWAGVRDATKPGERCPQLQRVSATEQPRVAGSEDCLVLNVRTPRRATGRQPVMVFLHGGGFTSGSGSGHDPTRLVTQGGVVAVTLNHRLGALGFLAHPALRDPYAGNFGLADQQAALRWVRANIAAFGGDPGNVTLWGQSAGATATCAQLVAPGARGLFHRAIVQSGPCSNPFVTRPEAQRRGLATASGLGCPDPTEAAECLRRVPFQQLTGLGESQSSVVRRGAERPWLPVAGTPALPLQPLPALRLGLAADVPLIQGGTRDEMRSFVGSTYDLAGKPVTAAQYPQLIGDLYGADAAAVLAGYPLAEYPTPSLALATVLSDEGGMQGSCAQLPANEMAARRAPVYAYEFAEPSEFVAGDFPFGAHHSVDLRYFFASTDQGPQPPPTGAQKVVADRLIAHWTSFARTGDPGPGWPAYRDATALSFAADRIGPVNVARAHHCAFWQAL